MNLFSKMCPLPWKQFCSLYHGHHCLLTCALYEISKTVLILKSEKISVRILLAKLWFPTHIHHFIENVISEEFMLLGMEKSYLQPNFLSPKKITQFLIWHIMLTVGLVKKGIHSLWYWSRLFSRLGERRKILLNLLALGYILFSVF